MVEKMPRRLRFNDETETTKTEDYGENVYSAPLYLKLIFMFWPNDFVPYRRRRWGFVPLIAGEGESAQVNENGMVSEG